jgi:hypothetical protein
MDMCGYEEKFSKMDIVVFPLQQIWNLKVAKLDDNSACPYVNSELF